MVSHARLVGVSVPRCESIAVVSLARIQVIEDVLNEGVALRGMENFSLGVRVTAVARRSTNLLSVFGVAAPPTDLFQCPALVDQCRHETVRWSSSATFGRRRGRVPGNMRRKHDQLDEETSS